MAKSLSILFVSSEVFPFAKVGGIADVAYSLPLAMREIGHDVRVMLPKYGCISERKNRIHEINRLKDIPIPMGDLDVPVTVKSSAINNPRTKVQAYISTNEEYFDKLKGVYHDPQTWEEYQNNDERFTFFCRSVVETCNLLGWYPDIIHCNDWQSALIPAYLKELFPKQFKKTKTVLTIHNFAQQGHFPGFNFERTGLPEHVKENFMHKRAFNFLLGGMHYADYITTVSPTYADIMLNDREHGNGLNKKLESYKDKFVGILNGIDTWIWNPEKDANLNHKYESDLEEFKYNNKVEVINNFELEFKPTTPLISMISRLDDVKGIPLLLESIEEMMQKDLQLVILGEGDDKHKDKLKELSEKYPEKLKVKFQINDKLAHIMEAGSDMFLMPSEFEPCGLNLMYSMVYGTVPILNYVGGMRDIATEFDPENETGNAIIFNEYKKESFIEAIDKALEYFKDSDLWYQLMKNGMNEDFSWTDSAEEYIEIYKNIKK